MLLDKCKKIDSHCPRYTTNLFWQNDSLTSGHQWPPLLRFHIWQVVEGVCEDIERDQQRTDAQVTARLAKVKGRFLNVPVKENGEDVKVLYDAVFVAKVDNPEHKFVTSNFIVLLIRPESKVAFCFVFLYLLVPGETPERPFSIQVPQRGGSRSEPNFTDYVEVAESVGIEESES